MDKDKKIGGLFTSWALFQKWYRMGLNDIFDFITVNGRQAWNMSTTIKTDRFKLDNAKFCWGLAEELLHLKDESAVDFVSEHQLSHKTSMIIAGYLPQSILWKVKISFCVCNLEQQFHKSSASNDTEDCLCNTSRVTKIKKIIFPLPFQSKYPHSKRKSANELVINTQLSRRCPEALVSQARNSRD